MVELNKWEREIAQDWHPKGLIAEELYERNRVLVQQESNPTPDRIHQIITTSRPINIK